MPLVVGPEHVDFHAYEVDKHASGAQDSIVPSEECEEVCEVVVRPRLRIESGDVCDISG